MGKKRGIRLGCRLVKVFKWFIHRRARRRTTTYHQLESSAAAGPISKLCKWVHSFLCSGKSNSGYIQLGQPKLPKGHLVVYVGGREDDTCRVLVPVLYFNHPLFGELLREAEKVYGFNHSGGIQIPCPKSELEKVKMKIAAVSGGGICRSWWR